MKKCQIKKENKKKQQQKKQIISHYINKDSLCSLTGFPFQRNANQVSRKAKLTSSEFHRGEYAVLYHQ